MWTLNNYTPQEVEDLMSVDCRYMLWGHEVGKENNTSHLQGVTIFNSLKTVKQVISILPKRTSKIQIIIHMKEAIQYCKKEAERIYETGTAPVSKEEQGENEKARFRNIITLAKQNKLDQIEENEPAVFLRLYSTLRRIGKDYMVKPQSLPSLDNEWIYGPTGTGKTRSVLERYPGAYLKSADNHWWDGYQGEDVVLIDDIDKYHIKQGFHLKIWCDHKPFIAETKGGALCIRPKKIIVTSNYSITQIWEDPSTTEPLIRRIKEVYIKEHQYEPIYDKAI